MGFLDQETCGFRRWTILKLGLVVLAFIVLISCVTSIKSSGKQSSETRPGLTYEPNVGGGSLIHYKESISEGMMDKKLINRLRNFMKDYDPRIRSGSKLQECGPDNYPNASTDVFCAFRNDWISKACDEDVNFGYPSHPCIYLLVNKVENWIPVTYQSLEELPLLMPVDLRNHIAEVTENNDGKVPEVVWIHCEGKTPIDVENIGLVTYYSPWNDWHGIPAYYFPFEDNPNYMTPMLPIQLLEIQSDVLLHLECTAWAKNLNHKTSVGFDSLTLEILRSFVQK